MEKLRFAELFQIYDIYNDCTIFRITFEDFRENKINKTYFTTDFNQGLSPDELGDKLIELANKIKEGRCDNGRTKQDVNK